MKKIKISFIVLLTNLIVLLGQESSSLGKIPNIGSGIAINDRIRRASKY